MVPKDLVFLIGAGPIDRMLVTLTAFEVFH